MSLRRRIILTGQGHDLGSREALIVRWIGARARKHLAVIVGATPAPVHADNVITLTWSETFGRPVARRDGSGDTPAVILAMGQYSGPATSGDGAAVRRA